MMYIVNKHILYIDLVDLSDGNYKEHALQKKPFKLKKYAIHNFFLFFDVTYIIFSLRTFYLNKS